MTSLRSPDERIQQQMQQQHMPHLHPAIWQQFVIGEKATPEFRPGQ